MRTDSSLQKSVGNSGEWKNQPKAGSRRLYELYDQQANGDVLAHSQSGHERNHLFLNDQNGRFNDHSIVSGTDSICDSRANIRWDFDRDGWQDIAVVNANYPHLQIFRNQMGDWFKDNHFVAVRLVGGNQASTPSSEWSNQDACGARIRVVRPDQPELIRDISMGEGFAGQSSATRVIGIGDAKSAAIKINWPSGKQSTIDSVSAGQLVVCYEDPSMNQGEPATLSQYQDENSKLIPDDSNSSTRFEIDALPQVDRPYRLISSMATWCMACKREQSQLEATHSKLSDRVAYFGMPMDPEENREQLENYLEQFQPPYAILFETSEDDRFKFRELISSRNGQAALPSTLLLDQQNRVVGSWSGVPTVSELAFAVENDSSELRPAGLD